MQLLAQRCLTLALVAWSCQAFGCAALRRSSQTVFATESDVTELAVGDSPDEALPTSSIDIDQPAGATTAKLRYLDQYQRGKIPIVLIHGLFSSPEDWNDLIGHLRSFPAFVDRFQMWTFGYPTGQGFL